MVHNGSYHSYARAIKKSFFRSKKPAENLTNGITNSNIPHLFMRDPTYRACSLLNLANFALSKPPPTLSIRTNARREKNNCGMALRGLCAVNSIPYYAKILEQKTKINHRNNCLCSIKNLLIRII